jgi:Flp pilus assembly protein TadG
VLDAPSGFVATSQGSVTHREDSGMRLVRRERQRQGVAAAELGIVFGAVIVPLLLGLWEVGRMVEVKQAVSASAREGARLAAQGFTLNSVGTPTQIHVSSGPTNVRDMVYMNLIAAGFTNLEKADVTVTFAFLSPTSTGTWPTEPYQGEKGQPFSLTVTVPWNKLRWVNLGLVNPTTITSTVTWRMLMDEPFVVDTTLPSW